MMNAETVRVFRFGFREHVFYFVTVVFLAVAPGSQGQVVADLDRDGIPNHVDADVDNDGILNGADRNIDGGKVVHGPLRGHFAGDQLPNHSPFELDMDADGHADNSPAERDIDGDGLPDDDPREMDIDGDGLADDARNELDVDGDGILDNARNEDDIDGDGILDIARSEFDIDGDGVANGLDGDMDGDGAGNAAEGDPERTGFDDTTLDILYETPGNPASYTNDALVAPIIAEVSSQLRRTLQLRDGDPGLRVRVQVGEGTAGQPGRWGNLITGVWRYWSADRIQIWAKWAYPINDPSSIVLFARYQYTGPYSGKIEDYSNPLYYVISEESRLYSGYATAPGEFSLSRMTSSPPVFISWVPGSPAGFYYTAPDEQATGFPPPLAALNAALASFPEFTPADAFLGFSGNLSTSQGFPGVDPILSLHRTIRQTNRAWYGQLEAQALR
ncbi:MAG: hypothetical protein ACK5CW_15680 [Verrucomicrobiota bacterium]